MTDSYIALPPDSSGKKLATQQHTISNTQVHVQTFIASDSRDPANLQYIDNRGQAFVRFSEGSPTMDATGNLRTAEQTAVGVYEYSNSDMADLFTDFTQNSATITHNKNAASVILATTSANNSLATRTTNRYHYYQPGVGVFSALTIQLGDAGKAGNVRRWGYFDEKNGVFFELNGTELYAVVRSSTTGSTVDTKVAHDNWNRDKFDGTGFTKETLDVTKFNYYFIDFVWQGAGAIRFGLKSQDGSRIIAHSFDYPNSNIHPFMSYPSLPLRWENFNTQATAGSSEMSSTCSTVYSTCKLDYTFWRFSDLETLNKTVTANTPLISLKANTYAPNTSDINRINIYPDSISVFIQGGDTKISIVDDAILANSSWSTNESSYALLDNSSTSMSQGSHFKSFYLSPGSHNIDVSNIYETTDEGYNMLADGSESYVFTLAATRLTANTTTVSALLNYRELR